MLRTLALRTRCLLAAHGAAVVAACLLVSALAFGGAAWTATHPPTTEVTDQTHRQTVRANVTASAVVAENSTLYEPGQRLSGEPVYLRSAAPTPTLTLNTSVPEGRQVTVTQRVTATYSARRDGEAFWENTTTLAATTTTTRSGRVTTAVDLDLAAFRERAQAVRKRVGDAGTVHLDLHVVVSYSTPRYEGTVSTPVALTVADDWYRLGSPSVSRTHSEPVTRTVAVPTKGSGVPHLGAVGALALLAGAAAAVGSRRQSRRLDATDLAFERQRLRYAEWISTGSLPADPAETAVALDSLEGVVDVAIDTRGRVIYDPDRRRYAVIDGDTVYHYDRARDFDWVEDA